MVDVIKEFSDFCDRFHPACTSEERDKEVLMATLGLLKAQQESPNKNPLPVKCEEHKYLYEFYDEARWEIENVYRCPSCGKALSRVHKRESILYCDNCGQKLDWNGGDDDG